jgi:hypothetical protein
LTYSEIVCLAASYTPARWYHSLGWGMMFGALAMTPSAFGESYAGRVKANRPVSARNCRKKPLICVPSWLTNV